MGESVGITNTEHEMATVKAEEGECAQEDQRSGNATETEPDYNEHKPNSARKELFQNVVECEDEHGDGGDGDGDDDDGDDDDDDSGTDYLSNDDKPCTNLQRAERFGNGGLPDVFQTSQLVFYERFKAYQDYMLGDCKPSEVKAFTGDYLEKVVESCDWQALWHTDVFDVLVEVVDVDYKDLRAKVELVLPLQCEARGCEINEDSMKTLLEATLNKVPLQELLVVYEESGDFDQTALALEHLRFFYKHIWRKWDEEDEDDEFDYFVRCVEPRLRMYYDILEDRVPAGLVAEYHDLLERCLRTFQEFSNLRNGLSSDSDSELDNVSMVEGLRMYEQMETLKRKLCIIENPLLRYVLGYKMNCGQHSCSAKGPRPGESKMVHVVTASTSVQTLQGLMTEKLIPLYSGREFEVQFHSDPSLAVSACYEGDVVLICPGHYSITNPISIADSVQIEGYGMPDEIVIEKQNKGDTFVESTGASVKMANLKFIQHDAIEGILCVRQGKLDMENCVLQCETTGVIVRTSTQLAMTMCDLYGSKGPGVEIYPGSVCSLVGNGIHHCKEGVLIKDFADELDDLPRITMVNNVIHNNEGYGVILVKPDDRGVEKQQQAAAQASDGVEPDTAEDAAAVAAESESGNTKDEAETNSEVPTIVVEEAERPPRRSGIPPEFTEGNDVIKQELVATSAKKRRLQRSRAKEAGAVQADEKLLSQEMFVSIHGNQFRRNGMGSFGTFLY